MHSLALLQGTGHLIPGRCIITFCRSAAHLKQYPLQVRYDPDETGPRHILQAVEDAGFEASLHGQDR